MTDLEFKIYKVGSYFGDCLAAFEGDELIFLGSYATGKTLVENDLKKFLEQHYHFKVGSFVPAKWTKTNFWTTQHKVKLQGTDFQVKVWVALTKIAQGKTITYSDLAKKLRQPSATRAVASAVAKNPICFWIPCHRVVGKNGAVLKYHWGPALKKQLLTEEGAI